MNDAPWNAIATARKLVFHDFDKGPLLVNADEIKAATKNFKTTNEREVRILCKQDTRESRPSVFQDNGLFLLPVKNGYYAIVKGEGYVDIPPVKTKSEVYNSKLDFVLDTATIGNSEMQHLDFAYASSLIRTFMNDPSLVLTIRGRKYTPEFSFRVGKHQLTTESVQTEVDAGYEGKNQVVLVEAKNSKSTNTIIRQLYFPYRQWQSVTKKKVITLFFEKQGDSYSIWQFQFKDPNDYNSIELVKCQCFTIKGYTPPTEPPTGVTDEKAFKPADGKPVAK
jgi:hypothetical protein